VVAEPGEEDKVAAASRRILRAHSRRIRIDSKTWLTVCHLGTNLA